MCSLHLALLLLGALPFTFSFSPPSFILPRPSYLHSSPPLTVTLVPTTSSATCKIVCTGQDTQKAYAKVVAEAGKELNIPGFRTGAKIPADVVENALAKVGGKQALSTLLSGVVETTLRASPNVDPIGEPTLLSSEAVLVKFFTPGEPIELEVKCDVWPTVGYDASRTKDGMKPYDDLKASYTRKPYDEVRGKKAMQDLRERQATLKPKEGANPTLAMGDACVVDMVGYLEKEGGGKGEPLPSAASGDKVDVVMEVGRYMAGLVKGLMGATKDETRVVTVTFPPYLKDKSLAGKTAIFDVTVLAVDERTLPVVDDAFASGVRPGLTVQGLEDEIRSALDQEDAREFEGARNKALETALVEKIDMVIPETLVTIQAREKYTLMLAEMRDNGTADDELKKLISPDNFDKYVKIVRPMVEKDLKVSMAIEEIAKEEGLRVDPRDIEEQLSGLKKQALSDGQTKFDDAQYRPKVEATLLKKMVLDLLAELADLDVQYKSEEEIKKFDQELMDGLMKQQIEAEEAGADDRIAAVANAAATARGGETEESVDKP